LYSSYATCANYANYYVYGVTGVMAQYGTSDLQLAAPASGYSAANCAMITDRPKLTTKISLYRMSSLYFYRQNQLKITLLLVRRVQ